MEAFLIKKKKKDTCWLIWVGSGVGQGTMLSLSLSSLSRGLTQNQVELCGFLFLSLILHTKDSSEDYKTARTGPLGTWGCG